MSNNELEQRLQDLETKLAYQDDTIDSLNDIVAKQSAELAIMEKRLTKVTSHLRTLLENSGMGDSDEQEVPPHY